MQTYNVDILPAAKCDIAEIYHYIALENPDGALRTLEGIMSKIDTLAEFPERCPPVPDDMLARQGCRMFVIGDYIAFFKIFKAEVLIYRFLNGKRDHPQLLML